MARQSFLKCDFVSLVSPYGEISSDLWAGYSLCTIDYAMKIFNSRT